MALPTPQVIIADDTPADRTLLKGILRSEDVEFHEASTGQEAIDLANKLDHVALMLLDIYMDDIDGYEVSLSLRSEQKTIHIPIIFITGQKADEEDAQLRAYYSGAVDFIEKPITPDILLAKTRIFIEIWRLRASLENEVQSRKLAEAKSKHLATHDTLTELPNRRQLFISLEKAIYRAQRYGSRFHLLFLDLDGFKQINDQVGHDAGDAILIEISQRLQRLIRPTDTLARFGGDEFIIVMTDTQEDTNLDEKLRLMIEKVNQPFTWNEHRLQVGISIGVSKYPQNGVAPEDIIKSADNAMYEVKHKNKNYFAYAK